MEKQYLDFNDEDAIKDIVDSDEFSVHLTALTGENLHKKAHIAIELARREIHIQQLEAENKFMQEFMAKLGYCEHGLWRTMSCDKCGRNGEDEIDRIKELLKEKV